jgi:hypothetical protein
MKTKPLRMDPTMTSMKMTLAEKPKLIPSTPPPPATLEGSLHPSQARTVGAFAKTAPINAGRKNRMGNSVLFRRVAQIDKPKIPNGRAEYGSDGVLRLASREATLIALRAAVAAISSNAIDSQHRAGSSAQPPTRTHRTRLGFRLAGQSVQKRFLPVPRADSARWQSSSL